MKNILRLKKIISQTREETGVNFNHYGYGDLLADIPVDAEPPIILALTAIHFCTDDGKYNGFDPGMVVVMQFLFETSTSAGEVRDVTASLIGLLDSGARKSDLMKWASQFYPKEQESRSKADEPN